MQGACHLRTVVQLWSPPRAPDGWSVYMGALARGVAADGRRLSAPMGARAQIYSRITETRD